jgi:hypothetical protein
MNRSIAACMRAVLPATASALRTAVEQGVGRVGGDVAERFDRRALAVGRAQAAQRAALVACALLVDQRAQTVERSDHRAPHRGQPVAERRLGQVDDPGGLSVGQRRVRVRRWVSARRWVIANS